MYRGWVGTDPVLRTPLACCEVWPPDNFPLLFYRAPKAPDMNLEVTDLDAEAVAAAPVFWTTGTGLAEEPSRTTTLGAMGSRHRRRFTVHDIDYRPMLWEDPRDAVRYVREAVALASVVVGNLEEVQVATGTADPERAATVLLDMGVELAIVKQGMRGVYARRGDESVMVPPVPVRTLCGLGAGDAFGGVLCHGLLAGWDLERLIRYANAAGAIVASRLTCASEMPTMDEIEQLLALGARASD